MTAKNSTPKKRRLDSGDREFFSLVREATFVNPFSDERVELDLKIGGLSSNLPTPERIAILTGEVHNRVKNLEKNGRVTITQFSGEDRSLIENVFLFDFFHHFLDGFDLLILNQIKTGDTSVKVPFAREALSALQERGFSIKDACHYFALWYQLRRAYFFIDHSLAGKSSCIKELRRNLWNNVFTHNIGLYNEYLWNRMEDFSTLILGETGTGKGTSAMSIGRSGFIPFDERKECFVESFTQSFVSLNLSQFPETLIESELFGHKKGAFTGAVEDYKGVFDRCSPYGSIFLDEIGEVSNPIQIKLLQVLQERVFIPVGSHQRRRFQGRVIAATNRSIDDIRENGLLRDDFFYRLCSDIIIVPPLRQRIQEYPRELDDLLAHTIERILGKPSSDLVQIVQTAIYKHPGKHYHWPGNVRELEQCVRRVLLKQSYEGDFFRAQGSALNREGGGDLGSQLAEAIKKGNMDAHDLLTGYCYLLYQRHGSYEAVARKTKLDRRTVKKYIEDWKGSEK
ncbi:MAG: sigma-54-dependent Fis family transcriptional regulator [Desulfobacterales bacterium]|nr:sigma-54-dependent Fis family transcriptional regulator [Desulfobacterales bacterium]